MPRENNIYVYVKSPLYDSVKPQTLRGLYYHILIKAAEHLSKTSD